MLTFYWSLGRDIVEMKADSLWGSRFYDHLSRDLKKAIPNAKGFSSTNLKYMRRFYQLYSIRPQIADETSSATPDSIRPQVVDEITDASDYDIL